MDSAGWFRHEVTGILPTAREAGAVLRKSEKRGSL